VWLDVNGNGSQDSDEPGLAGVTVTATWAGPDGTLDTDDDLTLTTVTQPNGSYQFTNVPPGLYRVRVADGLPAGVTNTGDPDTTLDGSTEVTLGESDIRTDINFGYQGNSSISGFVFEDLNNDGVRQPGEPGIAGVPIILTGTDIADNTIA